MKNVKKNSLICIIITLLFFVFILKDNYKETIYSLIHADKLFLFIAVLFYIISFSFDTYSFYLIINQYNKYSFSKTFRLNLMTKFFNGITPLASGGQPLQLYELHKSNIKMTDATNIITQFFIVFQIALVILSIITIIINNSLSIVFQNNIIKKMTIIGFLINLVILVILIIASFNRNFNKKVINFFVKVLYRFKIIRNKDEIIEKVNNSCVKFYKNSQILLKNPKTFILCIILQLIQLLFLFIIPLFIFLSISNYKKFNILTILVSSCYIYLASCYLPIPGATGGMEYGFISLFSNFISKTVLNSATILWRFVTYFLPVIFGGIVFNIRIKNKNK